MWSCEEKKWRTYINLTSSTCITKLTSRWNTSECRQAVFCCRVPDHSHDSRKQAEKLGCIGFNDAKKLLKLRGLQFQIFHRTCLRESQRDAWMPQVIIMHEQTL
jgi:hypothetical protein